MMPPRGIPVPCWLDPENRTKCPFPLPVPKTIVCVGGGGWGVGGGGWGGGLGNTVSFFLVPKPLGRQSVVFI